MRVKLILLFVLLSFGVKAQTINWQPQGNFEIQRLRNLNFLGLPAKDTVGGVGFTNRDSIGAIIRHPNGGVFIKGIYGWSKLLYGIDTIGLSNRISLLLDSISAQDLQKVTIKGDTTSNVITYTGFSNFQNVTGLTIGRGVMYSGNIFGGTFENYQMRFGGLTLQANGGLDLQGTTGINVNSGGPTIITGTTISFQQGGTPTVSPFNSRVSGNPAIFNNEFTRKEQLDSSAFFDRANGKLTPKEIQDTILTKGLVIGGPVPNSPNAYNSYTYGNTAITGATNWNGGVYSSRNSTTINNRGVFPWSAYDSQNTVDVDGVAALGFSRFLANGLGPINYKDYLGRIYWGGYSGTQLNQGIAIAAEIVVQTAQKWDTNSVGTRLNIRTTSKGVTPASDSTNLKTKSAIIVESNQNIGIGIPFNTDSVYKGRLQIRTDSNDISIPLLYAESPNKTLKYSILSDGSMKVPVLATQSPGTALNILYVDPVDSTVKKGNYSPGIQQIDTVSTISFLNSYNGVAKIVMVTDSIRGGLFYYTTGISIVDNGVIFSATGKGSGYWIRQYNASVGVSVDWWGSDSYAILSAVNFAPVNGKINFTGGKTYLQYDAIMPKPGQYFSGNHAILKRSAEVITTLSAPSALNSNVITVTSVPGTWKVGDYVQVYADSTIASSIKFFRAITNITGTTITLSDTLGTNESTYDPGGHPAVTSWITGSYVRKVYSQFTSAPYTQDGTLNWYIFTKPNYYTIENLILDGSRFQNSGNLAWTVNAAIFNMGFQTKIKGCEFYNMPNDCINGHGYYVENCIAKYTNASFVHLSANDTTYPKQIPTYIISNYTDSTNLRSTTAVNGHSRGTIEFSLSGGYINVQGNRFLNGGTAGSAVFGYFSYGASTADAAHRNTIISGNYAKNYPLISYSNGISTTTSPTIRLGHIFITQNVFDNCGANNWSGLTTFESYIDTVRIGDNLLVGGTTWTIPTTASDGNARYVYNNTAGVAQPATINISGNSTVATSIATGFQTISGGGKGFEARYNNAVSGVRHIYNPGGAWYANSGGTVTGAIVIAMPFSWNNTMMEVKLRVFDYGSGTENEIIIAGYNASTPAWANTSCTVMGTGTSNRYSAQVRLGHNGTNNVIIVGDIATAWNYPKVYVEGLMVSHTGATATWETGWTSSLVTDISAYTGIVTPTLNYLSRNVANGVAPVDANVRVPTTNLGSGTANSTTGLFGDQTYKSVVTSIGLTAPAIFSVSGSPVTASGSITMSLATQTANTIFAGPSSGGAVAPTFRALVAADIPSLSSLYINNSNAVAQTGRLWINGSARVDSFFRYTFGLPGVGKVLMDSTGTGIMVWGTPAANNSTLQSITSTTNGNNTNQLLQIKGTAGATLPGYALELRMDSTSTPTSYITSINRPTNVPIPLNIQSIVGSYAAPAITQIGSGSSSITRIATGTGTDSAHTNIVLGASLALAQRYTTTTTTLTAADNIVIANNSGAINIVLPTASSSYASGLGRTYTIVKKSAALNNVVIVPITGSTISGQATLTLAIQYSSVTIQSDGTDWFILSSNVGGASL